MCGFSLIILGYVPERNMNLNINSRLDRSCINSAMVVNVLEVKREYDLKTVQRL